MNDIFLELSLIIAIGTGVAIVMQILRQPLIIGHIITGLIVGPTVFNLVTDSETLTVFSDLGIALLLFLVGLGLNPKVIKEVGRVAVLTGVGQVLFTTIVGFFIVSALTDISTTAAIYVSIGLAFSSTIIILKLLSDKKEQTRLHAKIATGFLLVQDILATFALLFVSAQSAGGLNPGDFGVLIAKALGLIIALAIIVKFILPLFEKTIAGSQELLFLFSITWGVGIGAIFKETGFSLEVGALAAGVALANFSFAQEAASRLKPLRDFFIVLFFVVLGSHLDLSNIVDVLPVALALSAFVVVGNPIIVMLIMGVLGYRKKTSFKTSLAVAQISEFSLVLILLANKSGQVDNQTLSLMTVVGLITIAVSSYIILYDEKLYELIGDKLDFFERKEPKKEHDVKHPPELILAGYQKGGEQFVKVFKEMGKPFLVIDYDPLVIERLDQEGVPNTYGDLTDLELLGEVRMDKAKLVISMSSDFTTNTFLASYLDKNNPSAVVICSADTPGQAADLYAEGVSYVLMPHYIGSERIVSFIKKSGLKKAAFKEFRTKHMLKLGADFSEHYSDTKAKRQLGHAILGSISSVTPEKVKKVKKKLTK